MKNNLYRMKVFTKHFATEANLRDTSTEDYTSEFKKAVKDNSIKLTVLSDNNFNLVGTESQFDQLFKDLNYDCTLCDCLDVGEDIEKLS